MGFGVAFGFGVGVAVGFGVGGRSGLRGRRCSGFGSRRCSRFGSRRRSGFGSRRRRGLRGRCRKSDQAVSCRPAGWVRGVGGGVGSGVGGGGRFGRRFGCRFRGWRRSGCHLRLGRGFGCGFLFLSSRDLRKRTGIHPDYIARRPSDLPAREVEQRRNQQEVKGGDVDQIPPKVRVTHESREADRRKKSGRGQASHSPPPGCPSSRRVITPTLPMPTRLRMSITSMNFWMAKSRSGRTTTEIWESRALSAANCNSRSALFVTSPLSFRTSLRSI